MQLLSNKPKDIYFDLLNCFRMTLLRLRFIGYCFDWCFDPVITNTWQSKQQPTIGANLVLWLRVCFKRDNFKILIGVFCSRKVKSYWLHAYDVGWRGWGAVCCGSQITLDTIAFSSSLSFYSNLKRRNKNFPSLSSCNFPQTKDEGRDQYYSLPSITTIITWNICVTSRPRSFTSSSSSRSSCLQTKDERNVCAPHQLRSASGRFRHSNPLPPQYTWWWFF